MSNGLQVANIKLPLSGVEDGAQVLDEVGNVYEFNAEQRCWVRKGVIQSPDIVTEQEDGLVSPPIFEQLQLLSRLKQQGVNFDHFKLDVDTLNPYFYFFHSTDDLIRFIPEAQNRLRIEIDRPMLMRRLTAECCVGPVGSDGQQGTAGDDGKPVADEIFQDPLGTTDAVFRFETKVPTPIDTPISLRIFREETELIEFLIPVSGTEDITINTVEGGPEVELTSLVINYNQSSEILSGSIKFTSGADDVDIWEFKARQRGAKGETGEDGREFFEIVNQFFDDPLLRSTDALVSMRNPTTNDNIFFVKKPMFETVCSFNILPSPDVLRGKITEAGWVALRVTSNTCKDISTFRFIPPDFEAPPLDLPAWTPTPDCCDAGVANIRSFNWFEKVDPPLFFDILVDTPPPVQCCQEDFFWCPNVGDNPCGVEGELKPPPKPKPDSSSSSSSSSSQSSSSQSSSSQSSSSQSDSSASSMSDQSPGDISSSSQSDSSQSSDQFQFNALFAPEVSSSSSSSSASSVSSLSSQSPSSASSASSVSSLSSQSPSSVSSLSSQSPSSVSSLSSQSLQSPSSVSSLSSQSPSSVSSLSSQSLQSPSSVSSLSSQSPSSVSSLSSQSPQSASSVSSLSSQSPSSVSSLSSQSPSSVSSLSSQSPQSASSVSSLSSQSPSSVSSLSSLSSQSPSSVSSLSSQSPSSVSSLSSQSPQSASSLSSLSAESASSVSSLSSQSPQSASSVSSLSSQSPQSASSLSSQSPQSASSVSSLSSQSPQSASSVSSLSSQSPQSASSLSSQSPQSASSVSSQSPQSVSSVSSLSSQSPQSLSSPSSDSSLSSGGY
jgi:hypothetical protein